MSFEKMNVGTSIKLNIMPTMTWQIIWTKLEWVHLYESTWLNHAKVDCRQGDQIGRIFASWKSVYFEKFFLSTEDTFWLHFSKDEVCKAVFLPKIDWGTMWAIFSQIHQGPMLWFFKYFRRNKLRKNWRFRHKTKLNFWKKFNITWVFKKNANFLPNIEKNRRKLWS
jgi:hypothetical protein